MDLRKSRKNNRKDSGFTWKPNFRKPTGRIGRIHIFQEITLESTELILYFYSKNGGMITIFHSTIFVVFFAFLCIISSIILYTLGVLLDSTSHARVNNCMICTLQFFYDGGDSTLDCESNICCFL